MLERLSEKFTSRLLRAGVISESDADVYQYGFYQFSMMLLNIVTTLALGLVFRMLLPCILLNLAYIPLRLSAGGHHADTPLRCYLHSTLMIAALLAILKWVPIPMLGYAAMFLIAGALILWLAPVETQNHPLDEEERQAYRRRTWVVLGVETIAFAAAVIASLSWLWAPLALGAITEAVMLLLGIWKLKRSKR